MKVENQYKVSLLAVIICASALLSGCATTESSVKVNEVDPYEEINRPVYRFNTGVDSYVAKPMADAYTYITPTFMQTGVSNFFNNLQDINVIVNDVLQAKFEQGAQDFGRLALNTTLGFMGLIDVASDAGLERHNEDFGQTLAVWGVPQGSYLVLPFVGPATFREIPGYVVDSATNPANYMGISLPLAGINLLNTRAKAEGSLKFINEAAMDPYVFTREAFLQWRRYEASDGKIDTSKEMEDLENDLLADDKSPNNSAVIKQEHKAQTPVSDNAQATMKQKPSSSISTSQSQVDKKASYDEAKRLFDAANAKFEESKIKE